MLRKFPVKSKRLPHFLALGLAFMLVSFYRSKFRVSISFRGRVWRTLSELDCTYFSPEVKEVEGPA